MTPLSEYYDRLNRHDWTHMMSDDHRIWRVGSVEKHALMTIAKESADHKKLYDSMEAWGWRRIEKKPERPKDDNEV